MSKITKPELLDKLQAQGLISDTNKAKFEGLTIADLTPFLDLAEKNEELETALGQSEAELASAQEALSGTKPAKKKKSTPGHTFEFRGAKYQFADTAPKRIRFSGNSLTQKELAQDQDALLHLIGKKSTLITKIKE
ncbi:MAG: hypothetical protein Q4F57_05980 [Weeksellaceae bacterium]|nr:hypothetical protein [Weeksellaceae bacterium]